MQIMTLKQWHSNDRKGKINIRTCVNFFLKTGNQENIYYYYYYCILLKIYLNRKIPGGLRIIKDLRLKLLQTGS